MDNNKKNIYFRKKIKQFFKSYWGYLLGLCVSIGLILILFLNINNDWKNILSNLGLGLFSALLLGLIIDIINSKNRDKKNHRIFEIFGIDVYGEINSLLMILYLLFNDYYNIKNNDEKFEFDNLTIKDMLILYSTIIKDIKSFLVPVLHRLEVAVEDISHCDNQMMVKNLISEYENGIIEYKNKFSNLLKKINEQQTLLLINEVANEQDIFRLQAFLNLISYRPHVAKILGEENELIELGKTFDSIVSSGLADILNKIGFNKIRYTNKNGYFDIILIKGK